MAVLPGILRYTSVLPAATEATPIPGHVPCPPSAPRHALPVLAEADLSDPQRTLLAALRAGPRGKSLNVRGPFAAWMHAPEFGLLAQSLGAHCRYGTALPPRLSEFAILCTARLWRAQYEWFAHQPMAEKAGVKPRPSPT